jgi:hypothetical protein
VKHANQITGVIRGNQMESVVSCPNPPDSPAAPSGIMRAHQQESSGLIRAHQGYIRAHHLDGLGLGTRERVEEALRTRSRRTRA